MYKGMRLSTNRERYVRNCALRTKHIQTRWTALLNRENANVAMNALITVVFLPCFPLTTTHRKVLPPQTKS